MPQKKLTVQAVQGAQWVVAGVYSDDECTQPIAGDGDVHGQDFTILDEHDVGETDEGRPKFSVIFEAYVKIAMAGLEDVFVIRSIGMSTETNISLISSLSTFSESVGGNHGGIQSVSISGLSVTDEAGVLLSDEVIEDLLVSATEDTFDDVVESVEPALPVRRLDDSVSPDEVSADLVSNNDSDIICIEDNKTGYFAFRGEVFAEADDWELNSETDFAYTEVTVYRTKAGKWVAHKQLAGAHSAVVQDSIYYNGEWSVYPKDVLSADSLDELLEDVDNACIAAQIAEKADARV